MSKKTKYVVAGNYTQFQQYIKSKGTVDDEYRYVYVASTDTLRGISGNELEGCYYGTYEERPDITEIRQMISHIKTRVPVTTITNNGFFNGTTGTTITATNNTTSSSIVDEIRAIVNRMDEIVNRMDIMEKKLPS